MRRGRRAPQGEPRAPAASGEARTDAGVAVSYSVLAPGPHSPEGVRPEPAEGGCGRLEAVANRGRLGAPPPAFGGDGAQCPGTPESDDQPGEGGERDRRTTKWRAAPEELATRVRPKGRAARACGACGAKRGRRSVLDERRHRRPGAAGTWTVRLVNVRAQRASSAAPALAAPTPEPSHTPGARGDSPQCGPKPHQGHHSTTRHLRSVHTDSGRA